MAEVVKRLAPTKDTVFQLGAKSGNECAFPGCPARMFDAGGTMIGQICHIEAAERGGERFNELMTNEQRRHISNLVLMCYPHHQTTNNVAEFPTPRLQEMKRQHEARFMAAPQDLLLLLKDWTEHSEPTPAANLRRLNRVLGWDQPEAELQVSVQELARYTANYAIVPHQVREFLMNVVSRMHKVQNSGALTEQHWSSPALLASDFENAHRVSSQVVMKYCKDLAAYRIGDLDQFTFERNSDREEWGIQIYNLESGWPLWLDLVEFCRREGIPFKNLAVHADFSLLDE